MIGTRVVAALAGLALGLGVIVVSPSSNSDEETLTIVDDPDSGRDEPVDDELVVVDTSIDVVTTPVPSEDPNTVPSTTAPAPESTLTPVPSDAPDTPPSTINRDAPPSSESTRSPTTPSAPASTTVADTGLSHQVELSCLPLETKTLKDFLKVNSNLLNSDEVNVSADKPYSNDVVIKENEGLLTFAHVLVSLDQTRVKELLVLSPGAALTVESGQLVATMNGRRREPRVSAADLFRVVLSDSLELAVGELTTGNPILTNCSDFRKKASATKDLPLTDLTCLYVETGVLEPSWREQVCRNSSTTTTTTSIASPNE